MSPTKRTVRGHFWTRTTVDRTKKAIAQILEIPDPNDIALLLNDEILPADTVLADLELAEEAELVAREIPRKVSIRFTNDSGEKKDAKSRYLHQSTVGSARIALAQALKLDVANCRLSYKGEDLADDQLISGLGLPEDGFLEFRDVSLVEFRLWNGEIARIRSDPAATVGDLKARFAAEYGVDVALLKFEGEDDEEGDNERLLAEVVPKEGVIVIERSVELTETIGPDTFIELEASGERSFGAVLRPLLVRLSNGKKVKSRFRETATIGKMKSSIADKLDIAPEAIVVPNVLNDSTLLVEVLGGSQNEIEVQITDPGQHRPFTVLADDGSTIKGRYRPGAKIKKLRLAIAKRLKIDVAAITLLHDGNFLQDEIFFGSLDLTGSPLTARLAK